VGFGINHKMADFEGDVEKDLDLVLCTPSEETSTSKITLASLVSRYQIDLTPAEQAVLASLPVLARVPVGSVLMALEAKACMTEHQKAKPRLFSELNSSHRIINGASGEAIAAAYVMINAATKFVSPSRQLPNAPLHYTSHTQPKALNIALTVPQGLPRRSSSDKRGYDAIGITVVDMVNDGSPVSLVTNSPAPQTGSPYHYDAMINRLGHTYATRFKHL
jgi:hypothetical protein